jgi:uncharacterized membrane protein
MNLDNIDNIPTHPLVVHLPIVLVPLTLICVLVFSLRKKWHAHYAIPVAALSFVALIGSYLAKESGEGLEERVRETSLMEKHTELGDQFFTIALLMFLVVLVWAFVGWYFRNKSDDESKYKYLRIGICVVAVAVVSYASFAVYKVGHSGAKSVWHNTPAGELESGGD